MKQCVAIYDGTMTDEDLDSVLATENQDGLMSKEDKAKLDDLIEQLENGSITVNLDYEKALNKPKINNIELSGNKNLKELVYENIDIDNEVPDYSIQINMLNERCTALEDAVKKLQTQIREPPVEEEYPEWEPWDGMSNKYQKGDKVTRNGIKYISEYNDQNIWEPGSPGIDERYWKVVE